ncbi:hypothetical protein [Streptomyces sp. NPDC059015]|uniref:hypothetical protein n=1 Tax=unclassified Streptomyces TaxID=2593676 RepID=UPI0036920F73
MSTQNLLVAAGVVIALWTFAAIVIFRTAVRTAQLADEDQAEQALFAEDYMATFEPMREAFATAVRETEPGRPSAELVDCWEIWPDAPLAHDLTGGTRDGS